MRSELGKECRKLFRQMMSAEFPDYQEDKKQVVPQGRYVWTRQHPSGIWFHILLIIHHSQDMFTTEVGWGFDGRLPGHKLLRNEMHEIFQRPVSFRSSVFWSRKDDWWILVLRPEEHERAILYQSDSIEQCLPLVAPAVADAARKLREYVLPAFQKIVQMHGKNNVQETEKR
jgi:hypothetical protein